MTMKYEIDHEICDWEQVDCEIRDWEMTMKYEIDHEICDSKRVDVWDNQGKGSFLR
jgi:hypothetical protein